MSLAADAGGRGTAEDALPRCGLYETVGRVEPCPRASCAFWDDAPGAGAGCAIERLVAHVEWSPDLAHFLLALRQELALARDGVPDR